MGHVWIITRKLYPEAASPPIHRTGFHCRLPSGCYSLVGTQLDEHGEISDATRVDWEPGMAFVTPPGYWHAHINESNENARLIPIQDAGLQTYLRALDIRFS